MADQKWLERKQFILDLQAVLNQNFDDNGLCVDRGRYERCTAADIYFDERLDHGDGQVLEWPDGGCTVLFQPNALERAFFGLDCFTFAVYTNSDGFVFGKQYSEDEVTKLTREHAAMQTDDMP